MIFHEQRGAAAVAEAPHGYCRRDELDGGGWADGPGEGGVGDGGEGGEDGAGVLAAGGAVAVADVEGEDAACVGNLAAGAAAAEGGDHG